MGIPAAKIRDLYESEGPAIFAQERDGILGWMDKHLANFKWAVNGPKYGSGALQEAITSILGDLKIGDAKTRLMIPAFHGKTKNVYIFKTAHHERLSTDYKDLASDAAMATAAAPTIFREFVTARDVGLVDGGMWANNPTGIAVAEGIGTLGWRPDEIRVLSVGCLEDVSEMPSASGAIRFAMKMSGYFMTGQSYGSLGIAHILTGHVGGSDHRAIYRINQAVPEGYYGLDDTSKIRALKDRALFQARIEKPNLERVFFQERAERFQPIHRTPA